MGLQYLVKDGYDPDDKGQCGDQSLPDAPLGWIEGVSNHPQQDVETPDPSKPAACLQHTHRDVEGPRVPVAQRQAEFGRVHYVWDADINHWTMFKVDLMYPQLTSL